MVSKLSSELKSFEKNNQSLYKFEDVHIFF